jgi:hypothetical protein
MALLQIQAPDLAGLAYGTATLQLLEGFGYASDGKTLLVRATYTDVADGGGALHYAMWTYDLAAHQYTSCLNQLIAGSTRSAADFEVSSAQIVGSGDNQTIVAESSIKGTSDQAGLSLITGLTLSDVDYLTTLLGPDVAPRIERYSLSSDGRFLAIQTDSAVLAPEAQPDINDTSDIYLIDLATQGVQRVSYVAGSDVFSPVRLGNVYSQSGQVFVGFSSAASFVSADKNAGTATEEAQTDAYLWHQAFDANGLKGVADFRLLSAGFGGTAAGYVTGDAGVIATGNGNFFSSASAELVVNDANGAVDTFVAKAGAPVERIELNGLGELASGAAMLSVSGNGRFVALLTTSVEVAGTDGVQQLMVNDLQNNEWHLISENDAHVLANGWVTGGSLAPNGSSIAFTSTADNLGSQTGSAAGGNLYADTTGFQIGMQLDVLAYSWKSHVLLSGTSIGQEAQSLSTDALGKANFEDVALANDVGVLASRAIPSAETAVTNSAVNLQDAIAILKMIVGLPVNGANQALSPYQALAADFDGNGQVSLTDAIGVLKHVVGLSSPEPTWHFVDESSTAVAGITAKPLSPGQPPVIAIDTLAATSPLHVGLVGYLSGDVDGSFAGLAGVNDLDVTQPSYFQNLTAQTGFNLLQFGVYS